MVGLPTVDPANAQPVWLAPNPTPGALNHIATAGSYLLKAGKGWITGISVNTYSQSAGTLTVYDGTSASGSVMAVVDVSKQTGTQNAEYWGFQNGLFVVLSTNADITIVVH
jgi:hypothetical protein